MEYYKAPSLKILGEDTPNATEKEPAFTMYPKALLSGLTKEEILEMRALYRMAYEKAVKTTHSGNNNFNLGEGI